MDAFAVVAEPGRRRILDELLGGERTVNELSDRVEMSQPTTSKHLRVLLEAGMVAVRVDAQRRCYRLDSPALLEIDLWLARYRDFWGERIDSLEAHLNMKETK